MTYENLATGEKLEDCEFLAYLQAKDFTCCNYYAVWISSNDNRTEYGWLQYFNENPPECGNPPVNAIAPTTTGNDYVGQVLSGTDGTWTGTAPITYEYQWQRDGVDIPGATASTFTLTSADADKEIRRGVKGVNVDGESLFVYGNAVYIFTAEYQAVRAERIAIGAVAPSTDIQKKENKILNNSLLANLFIPADYMGNFASDGDTASKSINWKNPSGNKFIFNGSGTMVSLQGYKLDGTTAFIDTRLNLSTAVKYQPTNCCIGIYSAGENISRGKEGGVLWGANDGTFQVFMNNQATTSVWEGRMGSGTTRVTTDIRKAEGHYSQEYNGTTTIIRIGSSNHSFAQTGTYTRANFNLGIGCRNKTVPDQFAVGTIAFIYAGDATLGAGMRTILDAVMPTIFPTVTPAVLQGDYDPNNTAKLWQDVAKTIPATATNDLVRVVEPISGSWGDLVASANGERPTLTLSALNSRAVLDFDGTNDNFDFPASITGDHTLLWVVKNDDSTNGSHILYGQNYVPLTGSGYVGNASLGGEYFTVHPSGTAAGGVRVKNQGNTYNVIGMKLSGTEWGCFNGLCQSSKATTANAFFWSKIGKGYLANWDLDGKLGRFIYYSGALTDKQLQDLIISLATTYNL